MPLGFSAVSLEASRRHVTMIMAVDTSYSMSAKERGMFSKSKTRMRAAGEGACGVLDSLQSGDHVAILGFGSEIKDLTGGVVELSASSKIALKNRV